MELCFNHIAIKENEDTDSLQSVEIEVMVAEICHCRSEIKLNLKQKWQHHWNNERKAFIFNTRKSGPLHKYV